MCVLSNLAALHSCKRSRSSKIIESASPISRPMTKSSRIVLKVVIYNSKRIAVGINGILQMLPSKVVRGVVGWDQLSLKIKDLL
jgi:hypothetical protein